MSDIVERLRRGIYCAERRMYEDDAMCDEAAAEIERLRANKSEQVLELNYHIDQQYAEIVRFQDHIKKLRAALEKIAKHPRGGLMDTPERLERDEMIGIARDALEERT